MLSNATDFNRQCWINLSIGELLASNSNTSNPPSKEQIPSMIKLLLDTHADGNLSALARILQLDVQVLWAYINERHLPHFHILLRVCYLLSISPLEFLTESPRLLQTRFPSDKYEIKCVFSDKWKRIAESDIKLMQQSLADLLQKEIYPFPSLKKIANDIGCHPSTLLKYCPDLCKEVNKRYRKQWANDNAKVCLMRTLESALVSEKRVPLSFVARQVGCAPETLRKYFPDLCSAVVTRYYERYDRDFIQKKLEDCLDQRENIPSIKEIAVSIGHNDSFLWWHFPELCKQISLKRRLEREEQHKRRLDNICYSITQAALLLHSQGVYPSARQIAQLTGDPFLLVEREAQEMWRSIMKDLGYSTYL